MVRIHLCDAVPILVLDGVEVPNHPDVGFFKGEFFFSEVVLCKGFTEVPEVFCLQLFPCRARDLRPAGAFGGLFVGIPSFAAGGIVRKKCIRDLAVPPVLPNVFIEVRDLCAGCRLNPEQDCTAFMGIIDIRLVGNSIADQIPCLVAAPEGGLAGFTAFDRPPDVRGE